MPILNLQIQLFLLLLIGFLLSKAGLLEDAARRQMTNLVIYVVLPANIFHSFQLEMTPQVLRLTAEVLVIGFLVQGGYSLLNLFLYRGFEPRQQISLKYGTICSNAGFMGLPLSSAIFGAKGLLYASVALLPIRIFMWSSGLSLYTRTTRKAVLKTLVTHPCILAVYAGFLTMGFRIHLPAALENTLTSLSQCTTALSMILIGSILCDVDLRSVFQKASLYYASLRLVILPAAILGVLRLLRIDPLVTGVIVILAAMPAGSTTAMLAQKYDQDPLFASKLVFTSTLLSLLTLPIYALILT